MVSKGIVGQFESANCINLRKAAPLQHYKLMALLGIGLMQHGINFFNNQKKIAVPLVIPSIERIYLAASDSQNLIYMNKAELIDAMAEGAGISKANAASALNAFITTTSDALKSGNRVALVGFASFSVTHREARKGRNPQTGKEIQIAAKNVVKFKPGADLNTKVQ